MQCENCGAELVDGVCPECAAPEAPVPASKPAEPVEKRPVWVLPVAGILVLLVALGGWFLYGQLSTANGPDAAAVRMMQGFADYDAAKILDNVTHASLTETDTATFSKQVEDAKAGNNGLVAVKDIKIIKVTIDAKDPNAAIVQLSAAYLDNIQKKTYTVRTETLTLVKRDGRWLVRLFQ